MPEKTRITEAADACANLIGILATEATIRRGNIPIRERKNVVAGPDIDVWEMKHRPGVERITRSEVVAEYELAIVYSRNYDDQSLPNVDEPIPPNWVEAEALYVEERVLNVLDDNDNRLLSGALYPWAVRYEPEGEQYSDDYLLNQKVFRSEVRVIYREILAG